MTFTKVCQSWVHVGSMPLFRALLVNGATAYFVLALTFGLDIVANTNNEVGGFHLMVSNAPLLMRYSFITP